MLYAAVSIGRTPESSAKTAEEIHGRISRRESLSSGMGRDDARWEAMTAFLRKMEEMAAREVSFDPAPEIREAFADNGVFARGPDSLLAVPNGGSSRLVLKVDRAADCLPLELLGAVALKRPVTRMFSDLPARPAGSGRREPGRMRVLIVSTKSPRPRLAGLDDEASYLERFFLGQADIRRWEAPEGEWREVIASFHQAAANRDAIHFCGHAERERGMDGGAWSFQLDGERDYWLHPREIGLLGIDGAPGLVFSNTCGMGGGTDMAREAMDAGVSAFIQPAISLADHRGWELAANIYRRLADGEEIGQAVLGARRHAAARCSMLWAVVRLYGDPRWRLPNASLRDSPART